MTSVAVIGECMLEVSLVAGTSGTHSGSLPANLSFGGDVLNTAVYLARLNVAVDFVTAVGDDKMSDWLRSQWQQEGVGCDQVVRLANHSPGLYLISTDATGERSFSYWRDASPARKLFDDTDRAEQLYRTLVQYPWIYLTGISLAILSVQARVRLLDFLQSYRAGGGKVAFDSNYRPRLWPDTNVARELFSEVYQRCDLALLTLEDEVDLFGGGDLQHHLQRLAKHQIPELVIKQGPQGCVIVTEGTECLVPAQQVRPVDTTSAGDAFNAGYIAERLCGVEPVRAAKLAHRLAALVILHPGAIVPRKVTADLRAGDDVLA